MIPRRSPRRPRPSRQAVALSEPVEESPSPRPAPSPQPAPLFHVGTVFERTAREIDEWAARHVRRVEAAGKDPSHHGRDCILRDVAGFASDEPCAGAPTCTLRQTCPCCGLEEAHGDYCSRCGLPTGPADWHAPRRSEAQQEAARRGGVSFSVQRGISQPRGSNEEGNVPAGAAGPQQLPMALV